MSPMTLTRTWVKNPAGTGMRRWIAALIVAGMAGAGVVAAAPAAVAAAPSCLVVDATSDQSYPRVGLAVADAAPGDTLFVKGFCHGFLRITQDLTITGQANGGTKTATLDDTGQGVPTLWVVGSGVTVTLNNLVITGGFSNYLGGGLGNIGGTLTVNNSTVTGNTFKGNGPGGAGIANQGGTLTLNDTTVTGNTSSAAGGGILNDSGGTVTLNDSTASANTAAAGGGIANRSGTVTLHGSTVTGNTAGISGSGIWNEAGTVTLDEGSTVTGNTVTGRSATNGGGIYNFCGATLTGAVAGTGGNVYNNTPDDIFNEC
jgi:hypothetical protein